MSMIKSITDNRINNVERMKNKMGKLFCGKDYDSNLIYHELEDNAVILLKRNSSKLFTGSPYEAKIRKFIHGFNEEYGR